MKCGKKAALACGALRNGKILGYNVDYSEQDVRCHTLASGHANSVTRFSPLQVEYLNALGQTKTLSSDFVEVTVTNSQAIFTAKQNLRPEGAKPRKSRFLRDKLNANIEQQCRYCIVTVCLYSLVLCNLDIVLNMASLITKI